ncbi:methyltransferase domain protein [mine drainage metagenome]|uniref:Methyltransferase domain protein n=1 Tax=mine drainage metagenome TaxID=410659 RepID=A0A1J5Q846_9ZZZZ
MAHPQQIDFCNTVKQLHPHFFNNRLVLDIGSLDINGNNQYLFDDCLYLGVDLFPGKNVDFAIKGHELNLPDQSIDVIVSTECFEHDQFYALTIKNIVRMLKPGGLFFFSCATTGRPEHGTRRSKPMDAPFIQEFGEWCDYYKNLEKSDILAVLDCDSIFEKYAFSIGAETCDLYFWGIKKGALANRNDYSFQIQRSSLHLDLKNCRGLLIESLAEIKQRDERISSLHQTVTERDGQILALHQAVAECDVQISALQQAVSKRDQQLDSQVSSLSWRVTRPLRLFERLIARVTAMRQAQPSLPAVAEALPPQPAPSHISLIRDSGLFDIDWYLSKNPDVVQAGIDPVEHYLMSGAAEGRNPNPFFDGNGYLQQYQDVSAAAMNPLVHYISFGSHEGRAPHPLFDVEYFSSTTAFDKNSNETALAAYLRQAGKNDGWPMNVLASCQELLKLQTLTDIDAYLARLSLK